MSRDDRRLTTEQPDLAEIVTRSYTSRQPAGLDVAKGLGHVLVVDDQEDNRALIVRYLSQAGYQVRQASNGNEALASIAFAKPDVILMDVIMPGASGFEICRKLKADPETLDIPLVLITGLQRRDDRIAGIEAGADDFLSKPVYPEELVARVRSLMRLAEARRALEEARLAREIEQRQWIHRMFERYVSPKLVKEILDEGNQRENPLDRLSRLEVVALFADMRGFTGIAEKLEPSKVVELLNDFFSLITAIAYEHEATVFNMAGDSLLIGFGVPLPQADSAERAVRAACAMIRRFQSRVADWQSTYDIKVGLGIGISRGEAIAGNVGSPTYMNYTIIGDAVNVAARLMQNAKANEILISEPVFNQLGSPADGLRFEPLPPMTFKGKSAPMPVYCVRVLNDT
jgi:adenylate cyclase